MRYGFIKLKSLIDPKKEIYMEVHEYEKYIDEEIIRENAISLCTFDKIYIAAFPLFVTKEEIYKYNDEAIKTNEISLTDLCFENNSVGYIATILGCDN